MNLQRYCPLCGRKSYILLHLHPFGRSWRWCRSVYWSTRTVLAYLPILWRDRDWDYSYLLDLMEFKLRRMAHDAETNWQVSRAYKSAAQLREVAALCRRINTNEYAKEMWSEYFAAGLPHGSVGENMSSRIAAHEEAMYLQDVNRLGELFVKHLKTWWD